MLNSSAPLVLMVPVCLYPQFRDSIAEQGKASDFSPPNSMPFYEPVRARGRLWRYEWNSISEFSLTRI